MMVTWLVGRFKLLDSRSDAKELSIRMMRMMKDDGEDEEDEDEG